MKTKFTISALLFILVLSFSSCVSTNKGFQSSPVVSRNIETDPIKADIKVNEDSKVTGESSSSYLLMFKISGDRTVADGITFSTDASASLLQRLNPLKLLQSRRVKQIRGAAAYKALNSGDYDLLIHPSYTTTVKNYLLFKKYIVTVDGYGAKYENFRTEKQKIVVLENGKEYILQD